MKTWLRNNSTRTVITTAALTVLAIGSIGCRGNLRSAVAVATGRANVETLQTLTAQQAAQANPAMIMAPDGSYPALNPATVSHASFSPNGAANAANAFAAVDPVTGNPSAPPSRDEALAAILPELQQLATVNPAAQQRLLAQMQTADPVHWPLLIRRIKADLAVHQQLNQAENKVSPATHEADHHAHDDTHGSATRTTSLPPQAAAKGASNFPVQQASHNASVHNASVHNAPVDNPFAPPPISRSTETTAAFNAGHDKPMAKLVTNHASASHASADSVNKPEENGSGSRRPQPKVIENPLAMAPAPAPSSRLAWRDALRQAITDLDETAPHHPQSAGDSYQHARLRLLQLAAGDLDSASSAIPGLSSTEQSYWSHQLFAIAKLMDDRTHPDVEKRATSANLHLARAAAELDELSSLTVRSLAFCDKVYGFGAYDPIENPSFEPGDSPTLYAEVRNYKSTRVGDGLHAATLASSFKLVDSRGTTVDSGDFPLVEDECLSKRRDFHIQYTFNLPKSLRPGVYRLELTVEDRFGDKRGHGSIDLAIE